MADYLEVVKRLRECAAEFTKAKQYALRTLEKRTPIEHGEIDKAADLFAEAADALEQTHAELCAEWNREREEWAEIMNAVHAFLATGKKEG